MKIFLIGRSNVFLAAKFHHEEVRNLQGENLSEFEKAEVVSKIEQIHRDAESLKTSGNGAQRILAHHCSIRFDLEGSLRQFEEECVLQLRTARTEGANAGDWGYFLRMLWRRARLSVLLTVLKIAHRLLRFAARRILLVQAP